MHAECQILYIDLFSKVSTLSQMQTFQTDQSAWGINEIDIGLISIFLPILPHGPVP